MSAGRSAVVALLAVLTAAAAAWWSLTGEHVARSVPGAVRSPAEGTVTIILTGDTLVTRPLDAAATPDARAVFDLVASASFAFTNLEMNLLDPAAAASLAGGPPRWPFGTRREARQLASLGFDAVSLANNHAVDYGEEGLQSTLRLLEGEGLAHAGAGPDAQAASRTAFLGPRGRVALIALTSSLLPETRATAAREDIAGRPGVNALRYATSVTADEATFRTLASSATALGAGPPPGENELVLFGTRITRGSRTTVEFDVDERDEQALLGLVRAASAQADIVIVSVHSHEPDNASEEPAAFFDRAARRAIDEGASVVMGHGPHRVRAVERYHGGVIFYSLGNFLYQAGDVDFRAADRFDSASNLFGLALGAGGPAGVDASVAEFEGAAWWQGALAEVTFRDGRLEGVRLRALDLGTERSVRERGVPRLADRASTAEILQRIDGLSSRRGTRVAADGRVTAEPGAGNQEVEPARPASGAGRLDPQ